VNRRAVLTSLRPDANNTGSSGDRFRLPVNKTVRKVRRRCRSGWGSHSGGPDAALRIKAISFLIDGEVVIARDDGTPDFHALRGRRRGHEAVLYAFDLIEDDGDDLRDLPLIDRKRKRKRKLARLLGHSTIVPDAGAFRCRKNTDANVP
jgi:ATP-dependent DNA ligase